MNTAYPWTDAPAKALHRLVVLRREVASRRAKPSLQGKLERSDERRRAEADRDEAERAAAEAELVALELWLGARPGREIIDALDSLGRLR